MILDTKNMRLDDKDLTEREYSLLVTLLSNELVALDRIFKFIYGKNLKKKTERLSVIKNRLVNKTGIKIITKNNFGYTLVDVIEVK